MSHLRQHPCAWIWGAVIVVAILAGITLNGVCYSLSLADGATQMTQTMAADSDESVVNASILEATAEPVGCEQTIDVGPGELVSQSIVPYLRCTWKLLPHPGSFEDELNRLVEAVYEAAPCDDLRSISGPLTLRFEGAPGWEVVNPRHSGLRGTEVGSNGC